MITEFDVFCPNCGIDRKQTAKFNSVGVCTFNAWCPPRSGGCGMNFTVVAKLSLELLTVPPSTEPGEVENADSP